MAWQVYTGGPTTFQPVTDGVGVEAHLGGHVALETGFPDQLLLFDQGVHQSPVGDGGVAVGVGADTHYVNVGAAVQEGTQEASGVGERAQGVGVATDAEHRPDTKGVHSLDDSIYVSLVLHHAGRDVGDHRETLFGVVGA